jgi:GT2 family glycosyltransferase
MNEKIIIACPVWDDFEQSPFTIGFVEQMINTVKGDWILCIIDNASTSPVTQGYLQNISDPRVHVIYNDENVGYGRAANQGIAWGFENGAEYGVVLNNDVAFLNDAWIEDCFLQYLRENKNWLMGARKIDFNEGTRYDGVNNTEYLEGWCLVFHKDLWLDLEGFSNELFLWHEDVELCIRAKKKGYELVQSPDFHWVSYSQCDNPPIHHFYGSTGFARLGNQFASISETSKQYVIQKHFANNN